MFTHCSFLLSKYTPRWQRGLCLFGGVLKCEYTEVGDSHSSLQMVTVSDFSVSMQLDSILNLPDLCNCYLIIDTILNIVTEIIQHHKLICCFENLANFKTFMSHIELSKMCLTLMDTFCLNYWQCKDYLHIDILWHCAIFLGVETYPDSHI